MIRPDARCSASCRARLALLLVLLVVLVVAPWFANDYLLTVLIVVLYFAYVGLAWNIMMGFAGQLSLGHALYVGLGAYTSAALYVHFGIGPWIGLLAAVPISMAVGAVIGFLAFRFRVAGVYFAILTIAFAEFARIGFDHFTWVGGSAGFFLPVAQYTRNDLWNLRGNPAMFYYLILAFTVAAFLLSHLLLRSRIGYCWLAIREDEEAARAVGINAFRYKMYRRGDLGRHHVGGRRVLRLLLQQPVSRAGLPHLALDRADPRRRSSAASAPCSGPILGAFLLTGLAEVLHELLVGVRRRRAGRTAGVLWAVPAGRRDRAAGWRVAVACARARRGGAATMTALLVVDGVIKRFRGLIAVDGVSFARRRRERSSR